MNKDDFGSPTPILCYMASISDPNLSRLIS